MPVQPRRESTRNKVSQVPEPTTLQQTRPGSSILAEIFRDCDGLIEIRPLPLDRRRPAKFFENPEEAMAYALSLNGAANVYFGAGTRLRNRGTKADVKEIPGLW